MNAVGCGPTLQLGLRIVIEYVVTEMERAEVTAIAIPIRSIRRPRSRRQRGTLQDALLAQSRESPSLTIR